MFSKKYILIFVISLLFLSGCNKTENESAIKTASSDPPISVMFENGERAYTSEEYSRALLNISGSVENNSVPDNIEPNTDKNELLQNNDGAFPVETLKDITDHASAVATLSITLRTILNEYAGDKYTADFGYDSGIINFYGVEATSQNVKELEEYLSNTAKEMGLSDYQIKINLLEENGKPSGEVNVSEGSGDYNFNTYNDPENQNTTDKYVLNTNPGRMKIHYPYCEDVLKIRRPDNYATTNLSVTELQAQGYTPCGHCNPHD